FSGERYHEAADNAVCLNPVNPEDFRRLFAMLRERALPPLRGVLHCWSIDAREPEPSSSAALNDAIQRECCELLYTVQALVNARMDTLPKVGIVSQGAVQVHAAEIPRLQQSSLWGMAAVLEHEHPEMGFCRVDVDAGTGLPAIERLVSEMS